MIRRDYILRMIEEFIRALARIRDLKRGQQWPEAGREIDAELQRLAGTDSSALDRMSEAELFACVIRAEPAQAVHDRTLMLVALLKESGDAAAAQGDGASRGRYLKALHLLLDALAREDVPDWPDFVPTIEVLLGCLQGVPLPLPSHAMLMQHYERAGDFAKAEDQLFAMLDLEPRSPVLFELGAAFYRRLSEKSDAALELGNLPRPEVEAGAAELQHRRTAPPR